MTIAHQKLQITLLSVLSFFIAACSQAQELSGLNAVASGTYTIDKNHSYILFSYNNSGFVHPQIRFREFDATITLDTDNPASSNLEVTVDAASIDSNVAAFDDHLKSDDLLDVENHPVISFISTKIEALNENEGTVTGNLTILGKTHSITLLTKLNKAGPHQRNRKDALGFSATGTVKRSEWGLDLAVPFVSDEITLVIEVEFVKSQ